MRVTVVKPDDLGPNEANSWAKLQRTSPVTLNPFLSLTYAQAVGRSQTGARVAVIEDGSNIEAFIAYELTRNKVATLIGGQTTGIDGLVSSPAASVDIRTLIRMAALRGWRFSRVPTQQRALVPYHYRDDGYDPVISVINLTDGYDAYLGSLSKPLTKRTAEKRRALERNAGPLSFEWNSCRMEDLRVLLNWKSEQYYAARMQFSDPIRRGIVEELARTSNDDCAGILNVLRAGDRPVAMHLGLIGPAYLSVWIPAYDQALARFSPGLIMWYALVEAAAQHGIASIDFGYGQASYKRQLGNVTYEVSGGAVWASRIEEAARGLYRRYWYDRRKSTSVGPAQPSATAKLAVSSCWMNDRSTSTSVISGPYY